MNESRAQDPGTPESGDAEAGFEAALAQARVIAKRWHDELKRANRDATIAEHWYTARRNTLIAERDMQLPDFSLLTEGVEGQPKPNPLLAIYREEGKLARALAKEIHQVLMNPTEGAFVRWPEFNQQRKRWERRS